MKEEGKVQLVDSEAHGAGRTCFVLLAILFTAAPLNALLVVAIFRSFLRSSAFNMLIAALCTATFIDALLNLPVAVLFRGAWENLYRRLGHSLIWLCHFNSATSQLGMSVQVSCLVLLSAQRLIEVSANQNSLSSPIKTPGLKRYCWLILLAVAISFSTVLPVMFAAVDVRFFQERYSCSPVNVTSSASPLAAAVSLLTFGHGMQYVLLFSIWTILVMKVMRERRRLLSLQMVAMQRAAARSSPIRGLSSSLGLSISVWDQFWGGGDQNGGIFFALTASLTVSQFLLVLPNLLYISITQFIPPPQLQVYHPLFRYSEPVPYVFSPVHTAWGDGFCAWLRIFHFILLPILILGIHKPLRKQTFDLIGLCRQNNYTQLAPTSLSSYLSVQSTQRLKKRKSKFLQLFNEDTPVLFASCDGLQLRFTDISQKSIAIFVDLSLSKAGENVRRIQYSPKEKKYHSSFKNQELLLVDEEDHEATKTKKGGKSVRFSQKVNEIPVAESSYCSPLHVSRMLFSEPNEERRRGSAMKTLEMELANSSFASTSSSSLLLSLSQKMRGRKS